MHNKLINIIQQYSKKKDYQKIKYLLLQKDFHDIAHIVNQMQKNKHHIFSVLPPEIQSEVITRLTENSKSSIIPNIPIEELARLLHFIDEDDATDIVQYLSAYEQSKVLDRLKEEKRKKIEKLLRFGRKTAGGLMDLDFIIVKDSFTFKDIADKIQAHVKKENKVPFIILISEYGKVVGFIPHKKLILSSPGTPAKRLAKPLLLIKHTVDQEQILNQIHAKEVEEIGVVDEQNNILGIIHARDLLRIAQTEATENIYSFAGVRHVEEVKDGILSKVHSRYIWLIINLATAFLAASVVGLFQDTISKLALLAVYMPIVAGEGGNAATQTLVVVVRGLATEEISWFEARSIIVKESFAGLLNGVIIGVIATIVSYIFHAPLMLGLVLGLAVIFNLFIAGFFGALIPFIFKSLKIDPAVASSIFVTTATDVIGFFVFLSLGKIFLT